jgi:hypothetical protein
MASQGNAGESHDGDFLDRIDALRVLRADTPEERGRLLEEIGGPGIVEQEIVKQLSMVKPLWRPDRFSDAHRMAMRSLEVLDRHGARGAPMPRSLGPLKPIAGQAVKLATRWIVRDYQNALAGDIRKLYERREAASVWGSEEHVLLRRARINAVQVEQGLRSNPVGVPGFLLGGAVLSGLFSLIGSALSRAIEDTAGRVALGLVAGTMLLALSWIALYGASIARRRIRLTTEQPVAALWDVVGAAGKPRQDQSFLFASIAIVLLVLASIAVPVIVSVLFV